MQILTTIRNRCGGNVLLCLHYFVQLLQNQLILIDQLGVVKISQKFRECIDLQNFLWCPVPRIAMKVNLALVDRYITTKKTEKRPNAMEDCIKSVIMLKAATLLGDNFDTMSLQSLNPL